MTNLRRLSAMLEEMEIPFRADVPLDRLTTFRVGGPCDLLISPVNKRQIADSMRLSREGQVPMMVLGRGSNVLFSDRGYRGAILCLSAGYGEIRDLSETEIECDSGLALSKLCEHACQRGLAGLEFAYGIPGTVGGAVYMNAGAYGGEMKDVLSLAGHLNPDGTAGAYEGEGLALSYRHSVYSGVDKVITFAKVKLTEGNPTAIRAKMEDFMARRREKQPLELPSAGSTFKRPTGAYASALIDGCGLKGLRIGGAMVSEKHAGFIVNAGGATCDDILRLIERVRGEVLRQTGYTLECEVRIVAEAPQ